MPLAVGRHAVSVLAILLVVLFGGVAQARAEERTIKIGALLSLTGEWSSLGIASKAAMQIAVRNINKELVSDGSRTRVELIVEDTKLDPATALLKFKSLAAQGVKIIVGPQSSAELREIQPLAKSLNVIVVSQGSTASSLAIANDAVYRFCPTDVHEGAATAALMQADGIKAVVPIWRDDAGNAGLVSSTTKAFAELKGAVSAGVQYPATSPNLAEAVAALTTEVQAAKTKYGAKAVAVYLASFDEGIEILALSKNDPTLESVRWYGGDGLAESEALLKNAGAVAFSKMVKFTAPILGLDPAAAELQDELSRAISHRVGFEPDAFALAAYDATYVGYLARRAVGRSKTFDRLEKAFVRAANRYWGATGATTLDKAGDRSTGNYDFFTVTRTGWTYSSSYINGVIIPVE